MNLNLTFQVKDTVTALKNIPILIEKGVVISGTELAYKIEKYAKELAPQPGPAKTVSGKYVGTPYIRTGNLKDSIQVFNGGKGVKVGGNTYFYVYATTGYELWVEFGKKGDPYSGWSDGNPKHRYSTYPGANSGQGFMRLAVIKTSDEATDVIANHIIAQLVARYGK